MATPCPLPPARSSAMKARRQARRAASLSGSIRQFLTPEVWKQARHAARAAGCRKDYRWALQPLILTWAMMTWCAQGLRIKIGRMGKVEKPVLESDFDQYPE